MTAIERTAYPSFKQQPSPQELAELYTPTLEELAFAQAQTISKSGRFRVLVLLKSFQRLGYFPHPELVPISVIGHLRSVLKLPSSVSSIAPLRSQRRYQQAVRDYLRVTSYNPTAQKLIAASIAQASEIMDHPADLINVAIETLVKAHYELPAFSTLDRLAGTIRSVVNTRLFQRVASALSTLEQTYLDRLLHPESPDSEMTFQLLKAPPKSAKLSHVQALQSKFDRLMAFGDAQRLLTQSVPTKIQSFAAQARALELSDLRDLKLPKRRTLLVCLIQQAQVRTRDHLVEMFLKRMQTMHNRAKERLVELRERHLKQTETMLGVFTQILEASTTETNARTLGKQVQSVLQTHGGATALLQQCQEIAAYNSDNHLPLVRSFYSRYRKLLFGIVRSLDLRSTSQDQSLIAALELVLSSEHRRHQWLPNSLDLSFISERWRRLVVCRKEEAERLARAQLEVCIFTYLAAELKTGDVCVIGSETYADFRAQLLSWEDCQPQLEDFCRELGIPADSERLVTHLQTWLTQTAEDVDQLCKGGNHITISESAEPVLKRITARQKPDGADALETAIWQRLPERSLLDILCNVQHWLNWTRHFGPASGSEPKLENPTERYILTVFGYGCNLGPNQTARHTRGAITSRMLSRANYAHISLKQIESATRDIVNAYDRLHLPKCWGTGKRAAADGSKFEIYENNLMSEYHIRYGGYGGIAYHHVSDTYIALFVHFITCGVWEAVYILDGLLKNSSEIQPDTLHADTQGQSAPVFGLAYLLGIKLMPRIRNWKDHTFLRPSPDAVYEFIDPLFKEVADWKLIRTHWQDLMRVALSIKAGKLMPSTLLRKLGSNSRKNKLYQAFRELGQVVRTVFLLQYISDQELRRQITACTNIVEGYHHFLDWVFFGKQGVITENDPKEQEKRLKYLDLVASAVILQNAVDISYAVQTLSAEGGNVDPALLATLSPYINRHLKRYGDYVVDLQTIPQPFEGAILLPIEITET
ncbi:MAG: Tn3 family transposase [Phormidesmis sp. CAN_BIN44]|nr:Tn3 family transposase [Phormidesmis sp. CAN_BIN44]